MAIYDVPTMVQSPGPIERRIALPGQKQPTIDYSGVLQSISNIYNAYSAEQEKDQALKDKITIDNAEKALTASMATDFGRGKVEQAIRTGDFSSFGISIASTRQSLLIGNLAENILGTSLASQDYAEISRRVNETPFDKDPITGLQNFLSEQTKGMTDVSANAYRASLVEPINKLLAQRKVDSASFQLENDLKSVSSIVDNLLETNNLSSIDKVYETVQGLSTQYAATHNHVKVYDEFMKQFIISLARVSKSTEPKGDESRKDWEIRQAKASRLLYEEGPSGQSLVETYPSMFRAASELAKYSQGDINDIPPQYVRDFSNAKNEITGLLSSGNRAKAEEVFQKLRSIVDDDYGDGDRPLAVNDYLTNLRVLINQSKTAGFDVENAVRNFPDILVNELESSNGGYTSNKSRQSFKSELSGVLIKAAKTGDSQLAENAMAVIATVLKRNPEFEVENVIGNDKKSNYIYQALKSLPSSSVKNKEMLQKIAEADEEEYINAYANLMEPTNTYDTNTSRQQYKQRNTDSAARYMLTDYLEGTYNSSMSSNYSQSTINEMKDILDLAAVIHKDSIGSGNVTKETLEQIHKTAARIASNTFLTGVDEDGKITLHKGQKSFGSNNVSSLKAGIDTLGDYGLFRGTELSIQPEVNQGVATGKHQVFAGLNPLNTVATGEPIFYAEEYEDFVRLVGHTTGLVTENEDGSYTIDDLQTYDFPEDSETEELFPAYIPTGVPGFVIRIDPPKSGQDGMVYLMQVPPEIMKTAYYSTGKKPGDWKSKFRDKTKMSWEGNPFVFQNPPGSHQRMVKEMGPKDVNAAIKKSTEAVKKVVVEKETPQKAKVKQAHENAKKVAEKYAPGTSEWNELDSYLQNALGVSIELTKPYSNGQLIWENFQRLDSENNVITTYKTPQEHAEGLSDFDQTLQATIYSMSRPEVISMTPLDSPQVEIQQLVDFAKLDRVKNVQLFNVPSKESQLYGASGAGANSLVKKHVNKNWIKNLTQTDSHFIQKLTGLIASYEGSRRRVYTDPSKTIKNQKNIGFGLKITQEAVDFLNNAGHRVSDDPGLAKRGKKFTVAGLLDGSEELSVAAQEAATVWHLSTYILPMIQAWVNDNNLDLTKEQLVGIASMAYSTRLTTQSQADKWSKENPGLVFRKGWSTLFGPGLTQALKDKDYDKAYWEMAFNSGGLFTNKKGKVVKGKACKKSDCEPRDWIAKRRMDEAGMSFMGYIRYAEEASLGRGANARALSSTRKWWAEGQRDLLRLKELFQSLQMRNIEDFGL